MKLEGKGPLKRIWPGYVVPENDELFSSWIFRVAAEHKIKSHSFNQFYFGDTPIWNRDIDRMFPNLLIGQISDYTPLEFDQIKNLFLTSYEGIIYDKYEHAVPAYLLGLTTLGVFHRKRKNYGLLFCPGCLAKSGHYRKQWRLECSLVCLDCGLLLFDKCQKCGQPIAFHRLEVGNKTALLDSKLYYCAFCKYDLRRKKTKAEKFNDLVNFQEYVNSTISLGCNEKTVYSFDYFKVLIHFTRLMFADSPNWQRVKIATEKEFKCRFNKARLEYPMRSIQERRQAMVAAFNLLNYSDADFVSFCRRHQVRLSDVTKDLGACPYWIIRKFKLL